jgi:hypothetical protein
VHRKIGVDKEAKLKEIQEVRRKKDASNYDFNLRMKELKGKIDSLNE